MPTFDRGGSAMLDDSPRWRILQDVGLAHVIGDVWTCAMRRERRKHRIGARHPAGEVLLGLDKGVPVILVPRKLAKGFGLLVHRLVPIHAHVVTDEIPGNTEQRFMTRKGAARIVPRDQMRRERDRIGLRDEQLFIGCVRKKSVARDSQASIAAVSAPTVSVEKAFSTKH